MRSLAIHWELGRQVPLTRLPAEQEVEDYLSLQVTSGTRTDEARELAEQIEVYFREYRGSVYAYVYTFLGSPERAEELTQDVFLRLHVYLKSGNTVINVRGWVLRVAHNLAVNEGKRQRFEALRPVDCDVWQTHSDPAPDPEQVLLREERINRFRKGMASLTDHQRHCMLLRAEGLRTHEIAEILNISRGGVIDTLQRAVKRMRKALL